MTSKNNTRVKFKTVIFTILGMVLLAFIAITPDPRALGIVALFPIGMPVLLFGTPEYPEYLVWVPYIIYSVMLILFFTLRSRKAFKRLVITLFVLLILNVGGCRLTLSMIDNMN